MRRLIVSITFILLLAALVASVGWLITTPDFEPAITCLTLVTAITGLFFDRWLGEREHRRQLFSALIHEVYMNLGALQDIKKITSDTGADGPKMMPRFYNSTLAVVVASGVFATKRDAKLWKLLHDWLQRSTEANTRFLTTETYTFEHPETTAVFYEKLATGEVMKVASQTLLNLTNHLFEAYVKESGIDKDTVLFAVPDKGDVA